MQGNQVLPWVDLRLAIQNGIHDLYCIHYQNPMLVRSWAHSVSVVVAVAFAKWSCCHDVFQALVCSFVLHPTSMRETSHWSKKSPMQTTAIQSPENVNTAVEYDNQLSCPKGMENSMEDRVEHILQCEDGEPYFPLDLTRLLHTGPQSLHGHQCKAQAS